LVDEQIEIKPMISEPVLLRKRIPY